MCGIVGVFSDKQLFNKLQVGKMLDSIAHRGPDDEGIVAIPIKSKKINQTYCSATEG